MSEPDPIGGGVEFAADKRQKEIAQLLELLGPEPVSYFTDACRIMSDTTGLSAQTHLAAHLLRELDGRIRDVLQPMLSAEARAAIKDAAREKKDSHRTEIKADGALLGLDDPTIEQWVDYALPLHKFTHRASLAGPRRVAEFRERFDNGQAVLLAVLRRLQAIYTEARPAVKALAAKPGPNGDDLSTLTNRIPHSDVILGEFFSLATLAWFPLLRDAGYFANPDPLQIDDEGRIAYVSWPPAEFLVRAAATEEFREEVVEILGRLDTDNPHARDSTVEAALKLPAGLAARLAPRIGSYIDEANAWWAPRHSEELVKHLVDGGEVEAALTVTQALLAHAPRTTDWRMRHAFADLVPKLFPAVGVEGLVMLQEMLSKDLTEDGRERDDLSTIWRESIEGGLDLRRRDLLVTALNQSGQALIEEGAASLSEVVAEVTVDDRLIFRRIALHLVAQHPDPEIASAWLLNEAVFFDRGLEREYAELAAVYFRHLDAEAKNEILSWVAAGPRWRPGGLSEDEAGQFDEEWRLRRLRALPDLPDQWQRRYDELVERLGDPGDPLRSTRVTAVWSGTLSPVEKVELLEKEHAELLAYLHAWVPGDDWRGPSYDGLANALREAAIEAPRRFSNLLPQLLDQKPIYARHVVYGLERAIADGGTVDWKAALRFASDAIGRAGVAGEREDETWGWARVEVCRLILKGLAKGDIPADLADEVWQVVLPLTEDPEPTVESEEEAERRGSGIETYMWNAVRSQAIETVIQMSSWLRRQAGDAAWELPRHIREVLDRHVVPEHEPTRTVLAVYGRHFNQLYELDPEWAKAHASDIFPSSPGRAAHRRTSWDAFVRGTRFWSGSWDVLAPEYERALSELDAEQFEEDTNSLIDPAAALLGHLLGMYVQQCVALDEDSLIGRFFANAPLQARARFLDMVGIDVMNADSISDEIREGLQELWEWRADAVIEGGNASELAPFAWWFGSAKFDDRWSLEQLIRVLEAGGGTTSDYAVTHRLAELVETQRELVVRATALLVERAFTPHLVFGASDELRQILRAALISGDEELIRLARAIVGRLYSERHVEFVGLLDELAPES